MRDKASGHVIRSAVAETPRMHANLTALSSTYQSDCRLKFYIVRMGNFALFYSCDLDLDLMTFIYKLDPYGMVWYGMVCVNLYSAIVANVSNALGTLGT